MSRPSIIVVDDDPTLLTAVTGMVEIRLPHVCVHPFESPRLALAHLERARVDTLVTDLRMKELDGLALLRGAKALRPNVPVILVSGHINVSLASQAIDMGAHDVLRKPFQREDFLSVVTAALNLYRLSREVRTRRFITERLSKRVETLKRLIADSHQRPNTMERIQETVSASRELNDKSLAGLQGSLDRLWQHAKMADARLSVAQQRLNVMQEESRKGFLKRFACEHT